MTSLKQLLLLVLATCVTAPMGAAATAGAQSFPPPMTVFGTIADSAGPIAADIVVEAYIGDNACGKGKTELTGDGEGRVTAYAIDVVSNEQRSGCGVVGADVRIKVGETFAAQVIRWNAGPERLDLVFGDATPAPLPTFTPTPTRTPGPSPTPVPRTAEGIATPASTLTGTAAANATATATLRGGITTRTDALAEQGGDDGGFPVWGAVALVLGGIAVIGGAAGVLMARNRGEAAEDE